MLHGVEEEEGDAGQCCTHRLYWQDSVVLTDFTELSKHTGTKRLGQITWREKRETHRDRDKGPTTLARSLAPASPMTLFWRYKAVNHRLLYMAFAIGSLLCVFVYMCLLTCL